MKTLLLALAFCAAPLRAETLPDAVPTPVATQSITALVVWCHGYQTAMAEASDEAAQPLPPVVSPYTFRMRAMLNRSLALMIRLSSLTNTEIIIAYLEGRVSAFEQLADEAGEPLIGEALD